MFRRTGVKKKGQACDMHGGPLDDPEQYAYIKD
jgi:hypothetical protein